MPLYDLSLPDLRAYTSRVTAPRISMPSGPRPWPRRRPTCWMRPSLPSAPDLKLVEAFDVTFAGFGGHPVKGWLLLPRGVPGPLPCVVKFVGYGGGRGFPHDHLTWPACGYALFVMDTRGQGSTWSRGDTPDPWGRTRRIRFDDQGHPVARNLLLSPCLCRCRPRRAGRAGASGDRPGPHCGDWRQPGGGISLAAAGLDPTIKALMPDVPFLCDFPRSVTLTPRDPYPEISRFLAVHRDSVDQVFATLRYFDGVNFARRTRAAALVSVGLMDTICPPSNVFAAFNALAGPDKQMREWAFNDHEGGGTYQEREQRAWLAGRL